ncbi:hypothetical protein PMI21_01115 [Pseudomonas sp. GM18]|uniref:hypothetical protein n=1 Tax=Pseudomonas sp. GM18 TaxID=1144324 RepID=UPI00027265D6|nr:hypothetical protein [Pseudomonas sp. GM18]EJM20212.1 hypothetical protein PMI21_01115 [Pseudomonas sp. GM18]
MSDWSEVVAGAIGGGLVIAVQMGKHKWDNVRDSKRIYSWLSIEFERTDKYEKRSTRAIAKAVNLTPERVATLCHHHPRIKHVLGTEEELWSLDGSDHEKPKNQFFAG